jgi:hypothetical protein
MGMSETLTERQRVLLLSPQLPTDEHIRAGVQALRIIDDLTERLAAARADREQNAKDWAEARRRAEAAEAESARLLGLLRDVQLEHSRALIELSPALEASIIEAIGRHPRDGEEDG